MKDESDKQINDWASSMEWLFLGLCIMFILLGIGGCHALTMIDWKQAPQEEEGQK